jgi:hypothetical protein
MITLLDAKGSKTRTLDLPNPARQALWAYLHPEASHADQRDPDSAFVFTSQRAAWLRAEGRPDHLSERGIEHLWSALKASATAAEWELVKSVRSTICGMTGRIEPDSRAGLSKSLPSMPDTRPRMAHPRLPPRHVTPCPVVHN